MTRSEAVLALAKLKRDPTFLAAHANGDLTAITAVKEITAGLVGAEHDDTGKPTWTSGALTAEEKQVTGL